MHFKLPTLKYRRLRGDMIEVFKIKHNIGPMILMYHPVSDIIQNLTLQPGGNKYKLYLITRFTMIHENIFSLPVYSYYVKQQLTLYVRC